MNELTKTNQGTDSQRLSTSALAACGKPQLDNSDREVLKSYLALPVERERAASNEELLQILRQMSVGLAKRADVLEDGKLKVAIYVDQLRGYSREALQFMASEIIGTQKFMPLPSECKEVLARYRAGQLRKSVEAKLAGDAQSRLNGTLRLIRAGKLSQSEFEVLPDRWKAIADTQGLTRMVEGVQTLRGVKCQ